MSYLLSDERVIMEVAGHLGLRHASKLPHSVAVALRFQSLFALNILNDEAILSGENS